MLGLGAYETSSEDEVETQASSSEPQVGRTHLQKRELLTFSKRGRELPVVASPADQTQGNLS